MVVHSILVAAVSGGDRLRRCQTAVVRLERIKYCLFMIIIGQSIGRTHTTCSVVESIHD